MNNLEHIKSLQEQEEKKIAKDTLWLFLTIVGIIFLTFIGFSLITIAHASQCYSFRDQDARQLCLARENGNPDMCMSLRNWDERESCRQKARERSRR